MWAILFFFFFIYHFFGGFKIKVLLEKLDVRKLKLPDEKIIEDSHKVW